MSTLKVSNIQATGETASRAVSGVAAAAYGVNQGSTNMGIAADTFSSQSTNISGYIDDGSGSFSLALTNAMSNTQYVFLSGNMYSNNTACINTASSTTSTLSVVTKDADTSTSFDMLSYGAVLGDLA